MPGNLVMVMHWEWSSKWGLIRVTRIFCSEEVSHFLPTSLKKHIMSVDGVPRANVTPYLYIASVTHDKWQCCYPSLFLWGFIGVFIPWVTEERDVPGRSSPIKHLYMKIMEAKLAPVRELWNYLSCTHGWRSYKHLLWYRWPSVVPYKLINFKE